MKGDTDRASKLDKEIFKWRTNVWSSCSQPDLRINSHAPLLDQWDHADKPWPKAESLWERARKRIKPIQVLYVRQPSSHFYDGPLGLRKEKSGYLLWCKRPQRNIIWGLSVSLSCDTFASVYANDDVFAVFSLSLLRGAVWTAVIIQCCYFFLDWGGLSYSQKEEEKRQSKEFSCPADVNDRRSFASTRLVVTVGKFPWFVLFFLEFPLL